jgi:hypothetical protein
LLVTDRSDLIAETNETNNVIALAFAVVPDVQIIDDGDAGFSTTGPWYSYPGQGYQDDVTFAGAGTGDSVATWTFTGLAPGLYRVSATWSPHPNRATDAPFTVLDDNLALGTVRINQEMAPDHFAANGTMWRNLGGTYTINSGTLVARLTDNAEEYVIADAVRIERLAVSPVQIQDDGDPGFSASPGFSPFSGQGFQDDVTFANRGSGSEQATWTFTVTPGVYRVSATWSTHPNRATDAPFTILDGSTVIDTIPVNQELAPNDFNENGTWWEDLGAGVYAITGSELVVHLTDLADEYVIADAIRIERLS